MCSRHANASVKVLRLPVAQEVPELPLVVHTASGTHEHTGSLRFKTGRETCRLNDSELPTATASGSASASDYLRLRSCVWQPETVLQKNNYTHERRFKSMRETNTGTGTTTTCSNEY